MSRSTQLPGPKRRKTSSSRYKGKGRANPVPYSTPINSLDLPMAMRMPQEILNNIFNNLVDHPVHFTRVARVCKSWQLAADTHLYWRHLVKELGLLPPKPRAKKFKTYKRVVERDWGKFCSLCFRGHRSGHERVSLRAERIDLVKIAEAYRDLNTNWFGVFKGDNIDFQVSFGREYGILAEREKRELEKSTTNSNTKSTSLDDQEQNDLELLDEDQFYHNVFSKNSNVPSSSSSSTSSTSSTSLSSSSVSASASAASSSSSSSSSFVNNNLPLPVSSASNFSSTSPNNDFLSTSSNNLLSTSSNNFLSTSLNNNFLSTSSNNNFLSTSSNNNNFLSTSSSNNNFLSTSSNNNFLSTSSNNNFLSTSSNNEFLSMPVSSDSNFSSTLSSNGNFLLFPDAFSSTLTNLNFTLPLSDFAPSDPSTDNTFYPDVNSADLFYDFSTNDNDYVYISDNTEITPVSSSQDAISSVVTTTTKSNCSSITDQHQDSILIKHHLCKTCKLYIGQNCERSSVLRMLIAEQKLPYTNFSRISRCTNYVSNGIGSPVAIIKYLIEKKWFSENTDYDELERGSSDDDRNEEMRRSLALEMWVRDRIENGIITSFKYDPQYESVERRAPKSLWAEIERKIETLLSLIALEPLALDDYIEIVDDSDDNANQHSVILID